MLDNLPADLGEPKGEEVGVADLLPGFPVAHCTATLTSSPFGSPKSAGRLSNMILVASVLYNVPQENQAVDQLPPLLHPLVHLNLQVGYLT
jgi:hypothetical protein